MHPIFALGAPEYTLRREQKVPGTLEEVFRFYEDPHNLARITPAWLGFEVIRSTPGPLRAGTRIEYRLKWMGIPYTWRTLIEEWHPGERFVDVMERGPYILWRHLHTFQATRDGVIVRDEVRYRLPGGPLGALLHWLFIRRQIEGIFDYREERVAMLLGEVKPVGEPASTRT
jgi:ligand-binding SRPBCC domain-containing protein